MISYGQVGASQSACEYKTVTMAQQQRQTETKWTPLHSGTACSLTLPPPSRRCISLCTKWQSRDSFNRCCCMVSHTSMLYLQYSIV